MFHFLNRVCSDGWARVRENLEAWFEHYPAEQKENFRSRFVVATETLSAFWELYLYELFRRQGFAVTLHPSVSDTSGRPDFQLERATDTIYVEAMALHEPAEEQRLARQLAPVHDAINQIDSPNFFLWIDWIRPGVATPPLGWLRKSLEEWLVTLDPDQGVSCGKPNAVEHCPHEAFSMGGWEISLFAVPKKPEARGKPGQRALGSPGARANGY
jgi:hypothetical protein